MKGQMDEWCKKMHGLAEMIQRKFSGFYLAGGTALMLKHRYRVSEDLDFFSTRYFSRRRISQRMRKMFSVEKEEMGEDN